MLKTKLLLGLSTSALLMTSLFSSSAMACDSMACEVSLLKIKQHYSYQVHVHAEMSRAERLAYAKIRENRDYALNSHIRLLNPSFKQ